MNINFKGGYCNYLIKFFYQMRITAVPGQSPVSPWTKSIQSMNSLEFVPGHCSAHLDSLDFFQSVHGQSPDCLSTESLDFVHGLLSSPDAERIANSIDPDQQSDLGLHCLPRPVCPKT